MRSAAPARLTRQPPAESPPFLPAGEYLTRAIDLGYVEEEWFATGEDGAGRPYSTQVLVRRPKDPARFSGVVLVEPLHIHRVAPIYMYSSPYILRSGHGWACVASQKSALDAHVKPSNPQRYASLHIETDAPPGGVRTDLTSPPFRGASAGVRTAWWDQLARFNQASSAVLAQVGAALRAAGPFAAVSHVLLVGHSQTGFVTTNFIREAHESQRLPGGAPVFDGFFPSGWPTIAFSPCDVPLVQVLSDGDISDPNFSFQPGHEGRRYRRPDGDSPGDRYRLYELASVPHMGTRYPPHDDPGMWQQVATAGAIPLDATMNSLPHHELFDMSLHHLVQWVARGAAPPRADRIEVGADGYFAKDEQGNSRGGVRCVQLDVPRATYHPNPLNPDGTPGFGTIGTEVPFDKAKMQALYGNPASYLERFNRRLDELIDEGWFLAEDSEGMRAEAREQKW
ncbi:MAG TPA: alpha/beta hydrolase domain-containing protein [Steroidobacteraceae bacterium]|nr:alpha/beta hydrolase domain-containing protein [Steroidobacteraceae bacterium]